MTEDSRPQHDLGDALARTVTVQRILARHALGIEGIDADVDAIHLSVARIEDALRHHAGDE